MKKQILITASLIGAVGAFAQGTVNFNNRVVSGAGAQGPIQAPIYGPEVGSPSREIHGQSAIGNPVGATVYTGPLLNGTGFTAQLWGGSPTATAAQLQLGTTPTGSGFATTTFRTGTTTVGYVNPLADAVVIPGAPAGSGSRANLEVRAWDNQNNTITTWAMALANPTTVAQGSSGIFQPAFDLGGGTVTPPNLIGMQSFNLHIVPEPSVIALGVLGLGALLLRRRK